MAAEILDKNSAHGLPNHLPLVGSPYQVDRQQSPLVISATLWPSYNYIIIILLLVILFSLYTGLGLVYLQGNPTKQQDTTNLSTYQQTRQ